MRLPDRSPTLGLRQVSTVNGLSMQIRRRLPASFKTALRAIRRGLQLTPMKRVLKELKNRGVSLDHSHALEMFGAYGDNHLRDYASLVSTLEVWEIDPACEQLLRKTFPTSTVKITDSYQEIRRATRKYDFIVVDNGVSIRGNGYCEHFDLFPDIFRIAADSCVLIVNVVPEIDAEALKAYPYLFSEEQLARRRSFYKTDHPERVTFAQMVAVYIDLSKAAQFTLDWCFVQKRNFIYYLVLHISKVSPKLSSSIDNA